MTAWTANASARLTHGPQMSVPPITINVRHGINDRTGINNIRIRPH